MDSNVIVVCAIICTGLLLFFAYMDLNLSERDFRKKEKILERKNSELESRVIDLRMRLTLSERTNRVLSNNIDRIDNSFLINDEIKQAVKYARDKSHPDNGGRKEDFVRYQELYKKICK